MINHLLITYEALAVPLTAMIITQIIKLFIDWSKGKKTPLAGYGGMPSSHSALFIALMIVAWHLTGATSVAFAISVVLYLTVIRDAMGIRQQLGSHGAMLKQIIEEHQKDHEHNIPHEKIITRLGHTPLQVFVGTICGSVIAFTMIYIIDLAALSTLGNWTS